MKNRIIICTAKFSDNLGDGVISECVDYLIGRSSSAYPVVHLDISGRTEYLDSNKKNSSVFKRIYHLSPKAVRPLLTIAGWLVIFRKRLKLRLAEIKFRPGDALIFGGGQVVSDISLNFPLKLSFIYKAATKKGVKVSFNAVGVGGAFSFLGKKLVQPIFDSNLTTFTSVRDPLSKKHLEDLTNGSIVPVITSDPGLWSSECYEVHKQVASSEHLRIGLGVSHPAELSAHSDNRGHSDYFEFWMHLIKSLLAEGKTPVLFTNGSQDDVSFLKTILVRLEKTKLLGRFEVASHPLKPKDLVKTISSFNCLISHRLHANIIAHSLHIPSIALSWDAKVQSYCDLIGCTEWCVSDRKPIDVICKNLNSALSKGVDVKVISALKETALLNIKAQIEMGKL